MLESITIFGRALPTYGIFAVLGFLSCLLYIFYQTKRNGLSFDEASNIIVYAFLGAVAGGKLLYMVQHLHELIQYPDVIFQSLSTVITYFSSGFVFYGGLIGAVLACILYARQFHMDIRSYVALFIPAIPLFHFFGRIGCFLSGCCYGIELESPLAILYHSSMATPVECYRFPVQLYEAAGNLLLFLSLAVMSRKKAAMITLLMTYSLSYAMMRFVLEFFRGDEIRGIYLLSTSQWISIALILFSCWVLKDKKQRFLSLFQQEQAK